MVQFKEHENGKKSGDPKVSKLDKLATLLGVKIHIDGVEYGSEKTPKPEIRPEVINPSAKSEPIVIKKPSTPRKRTPKNSGK